MMTRARPRLLLADDDEAILKSMARVLTEAFDVTVAHDGDEALGALAAAEYDCIAVDQRMPGRTGTEVLEVVRLRSPATRRVLFTASDDPRDVERAVNLAHIHAFFAKPLRLFELREGLARLMEQKRLEELNRALLLKLEEQNATLATLLEQVRGNERALEEEVRRRTEELRVANVELSRLALQDPLTGLKNRRAFEDDYARELARAARNKTPLSVLFIDVDHFKTYNDTHGHPAGDRLLQKIASLFEAGSIAAGRAADVVARYGGEEFVIVLPDTQKAGALVRGERVRQIVESTVFDGASSQPAGRITISIGVATYPDDAKDDTELLLKADNALLQAKLLGRNNVRVWEEASSKDREDAVASPRA
jgi:diguanylate cyclase (GGDEF)-like protein